MSTKKDLVTQEEIDKCLKYISDSNDESAQLLKLLQEIQITVEDHKIEDSIDGARIRVTYVTAISRKRAGIDEDAIRFQYIKEFPIDFNKVPIRLRDNKRSGTAPSAVDRNISHDDNVN